MSKIVLVKYTVLEAFQIPKDIDLEDKSVVEFWAVKDNVLYIYYVDGSKKKIEPVGWVDDYDFKHPNGEPTIENAGDYGFDDEEEEEEKCVCKGCEKVIDEDGFCTEGCRFGEFAGCWTCQKCSIECVDCEFCPKCGYSFGVCPKYEKEEKEEEEEEEEEKEEEEEDEEEEEEPTSRWVCEECMVQTGTNDSMGIEFQDSCLCEDCYNEETAKNRGKVLRVWKFHTSVSVNEDTDTDDDDDEEEKEFDINYYKDYMF